MAFWGIEVKPGRPHTHRFDQDRGRLHLSQATLGTGSSTKKSILRCNVGDKRPIYLCSLLPEKLETCPLNLEFEEEDEVIFSVLGPHSIHLSGFFLNQPHDAVGDDYGSDSYEEDIAETETDESTDYDSEDDSEDDFIVDDLHMFPPSPVPKSRVVIEEIGDDEKPSIQNSTTRQEKKKQSSTSGDRDNSEQQLIVKGDTGVRILESEDEDGFPISLPTKVKTDAPSSKGTAEGIKDKRTNGKTSEKKAKDDLGCAKSLKRKVDAIAEDGELTRETGQHSDSTPTNTEVVPETDKKKKKENKKKKKARNKEEKASETGTISASCTQPEAATMDTKHDLLDAKEHESHDQKLLKEKSLGNDADSTIEGKKKKKKKNKKQDSEANVNTDQSVPEKNGSVKEVVEKSDTKPYQVRSFPNGLIIEELKMGKPDGKKASPGKKVSVHYIGKLKKNEKIVDSNIGRAPFKFILGVGQVIKGWDVGVNGMRIGDKRRLTVPPAMGYGTQGAGAAIPPNSWLVFDVELVDVH